MASDATPALIVGSGNIGTDLMYKLLRSRTLRLAAMVGIDPESPGLARARAQGIATSHQGVDDVLGSMHHNTIVFEATTARAHVANAALYADAGLTAVDLTPAGVGPSVVPTVNLDQHIDRTNVNLITCGGQAAIPIVAAVRQTAEVPYAEIVSTVASVSAGPGTRENIDEFTRTTSRALELVGGAGIGKAIMILNPAVPPILMRNTVFCGLGGGVDREAVTESISKMVSEVQRFVPGYRLKAPPVFDDGPFATPAGPLPGRVTVLLEVEGSGDYLPPYAGNLDIMTSAAVRVGEALARSRIRTGAAPR